MNQHNRLAELDSNVVSAKPVKSFFVRMLTRDIELSDAILDLLDNCMDGVIRSAKTIRSAAKPYSGYSVHIDFDGDTFTISDNCGGIPWTLHQYAFRLGRAGSVKNKLKGSIGTYGIGMKRALFKLGRHSIIQTQSAQHIYEVEIKPEWLDQEDEWDLPVTPLKPVGDEDGTIIIISELYEDVKAMFGLNRTAFAKELREKIESHYARIIEKGFMVYVNNQVILPRPIRIRYSKSRGGIQPYIYESTIDGVDVFLAVGFTRPIPSLLDVQSETEIEKYSTMDAGWTVICNDRVVVYCDRSELTGWGETGVPKYHTQFRAITGIVEFRSDNPRKLPMTTTKRGIDASSLLYLRVKNKMREGVRMFTSFTNQWKSGENAAEAKKMIRDTEAITVTEIRKRSKYLKKMKVKQLGGRQYKPKLPSPIVPDRVRLSFARHKDEVQQVAAYLEDPYSTPSAIGARCFDIMHRESKL